ncbi:MAG: GH3 auxin-responsive promoter family protein [Myxococcales bacterium]
MKSIPGSSITGRALWAAAQLRVAMWDRLAASPDAVERVQRQTLLDYCNKAKDTEFGRANGLGEVRTPEDFRRKVPVRNYGDFEPYLVRMRQGEHSVLWPGLIPFYGCSSGTSHTASLNKYLPISREQIGWQQKAGADVVFRYLSLTGDSKLTGGYLLGLFPPGTVKREGPVGVASNPGIMQLFLPSFSKLMTLPKPAVRDIENYSQKLDAIASAYLDYDVRGISGTTCWFPIFFERLIKAARARGRDVSTVNQIWPNLHALFGGGVTAEPYRPVITERLGHPGVVMDNYNATEGGIFAATWSLNDDSLLMIPDRGVYFEFVRRDRPEAGRVGLCEVERDVDYSVVLTTSSGLFAYEIGDYIRFTSLFPHRMRFSGRKSGVLSLTQELMTQGEIERAVGAAAAGAHVPIVEFAAGPDVGVGGTAKGRYTLFVEFERSPADLAAFALSFDQSLREQNRVYREHRANDVAILAPEVVPLPRGATRRFMEELGQHSVQQKFPRIIDTSRSKLLRSLAATSDK